MWLASWCSLATWAQTSTPAPAPLATPSTDDGFIYGEDTEVIVYGDLFARWDDTRWAVATEMVLPFPELLVNENFSFLSAAMQVRAVLQCNKDIKTGRRNFQVACTIEDIGFTVAPFEAYDLHVDRVARANELLLEIDEKLTGNALQLRVDDRGQVTSSDVEGIGSDSEVDKAQVDVMQRVLYLVAMGFDLRLRDGADLRDGKWYEYDVPLLRFPSSSGSSVAVHYLNQYKGHTLVQSIGKGTTMANIDSTNPLAFTMKLAGVSIFDKSEGYMMERVWSVSGVSSGGMMVNAYGYKNVGRIEMLEKDTPIDVGETRCISLPPKSSYSLGKRREKAVEGAAALPEWVSIEETPIRQGR